MPSLFRYRRALLALLPVLLAVPAAAQSWAAPARELADKIVAHAQSRSAISISVRNLSSLSASDAAQVRQAIETELHGRGVQLVSVDRAVDEVRLTLSENTDGYLWVAEIGHADSWDVVMTQAPFPAVPDRASGSITIRKNLIWMQPEPMLDFATADLASGSVLLVLEPERIALYRVANGHWRKEDAAPVTHVQPFPRDARGRLVLQRDGTFTAYLPGLQCNGNVQSHLTATCSENDEAWPLGSDVHGLRAFFNSSRDYFTGAVVPALGALTKLPPFYSAAALQDGSGTVWLFALLDGNTRMVSAGGENLGFIGGSGSDLAGIRNGCTQDFLVLTTRAGDGTRPDAVQAFALTAGEPSEAGPSTEVAGPLLSLWTTPEGDTATAVSRNLKTKQYEAITLTVVCGR